MGALSVGNHGAQADVSGEQSIWVKWSEDIYIHDADDGSAQSLTGLSFQMQFRRDRSQTSADVTLSTSAGTLSLVADSGAVTSIIRIAAAPGTFENYEGDMICDLVATDGSGDETHYAHGVVTFLNDPVAV